MTTNDKTAAEMLREVLATRPEAYEELADDWKRWREDPHHSGYYPEWQEELFRRAARAFRLGEEIVALVEELPSSTRLRLLADWIDLKYPDDPNPEVQDDLRKTADALDALHEKLEKEVTK